MLFNNKLKCFLGLSALLSIVACSSMDADSSKDGNWPADFKTSEYSRINPDIANAQRKDSLAAAKKTAGCIVSTTDTSEDVQMFFSGDSNDVKTLYLDYAGLSVWPGYEQFHSGALYADFRVMVISNYHICKNTAAQDVAYLNGLPIDSSLIAQQYMLAGRIEGRAYRYCLSGETNVLQDTLQGELSSSGHVFSYLAHTYCLSAGNNQKYLIE